ncbi:MAG: type II toxin-antitoxin system VapC family toxin [Proteobacteria bacterium]|nr:type II toxin-antitoxin system VapC family toxin [Pseudomonadota bacterium]
MTSEKIMVDSNVLLDVLTEDASWFEWSAAKISQYADQSILCINPIIYSEVSMGFECIEDLEAALPEDVFTRVPLPFEAAFLAGKCFLKYRRAGGVKRSPLPDFLIGAHAAVKKMTLLTRDSSRFRSYFPGLNLICP